MIEVQEDLWPPDFPEAADPAPVALLKEQAELLSRKTNGEIEGVVRMIIENGTANHIFYLKPTPVGELMVAILMISYSAFREPDRVYPITGYPPGDGAAGYGLPVTIASDIDFKKWLREQLSSKHVMSTIGVLKNYLREMAEARASWAS